MTTPIIPPYLVIRAAVAPIFAHYLEQAERAQNSPMMAQLEALRDDVLAAIDARGGDASSH